MNILLAFISEERFQYADFNKLSSSLRQALDYYNFLLIILDRYKKASKKYFSIYEEHIKLIPRSGKPTPLTLEEVRLMKKLGQLTTLVQLEILSLVISSLG